MKVVYVTGCLGFIGSYVTRKCLQKGWYVRGIDKMTYAANTSFLEEFSKYNNFVFERKDVKDLDHLYDCDYIINTAAESHVGNSIVKSDDFSTDEVYGYLVSGYHTEDSLLRPSNPYAAAKASADMLITAWARTYGVEYIILRPTNNYGIGQYPEKLIPLSVKKLFRGKKIRLHNNGEPVRNWLHADDTAEAVLSIIDSGKVNEIYNVAGGHEQKNSETVRKIVLHYHNTQDWRQYVDFSYSRPGQDVRYALDDSKLRQLGWQPNKSFDEEIQKIVEYHKNKFVW